MKNHFFVFIISSLFSITAFADPVAKPVQWTKYAQSGAFEDYYDSSSVKPDGKNNLNVSAMRNLLDRASCSNLGYTDPITGMLDFCHRSMVWAMKIDCKNRTYMRGTRTMYQNGMATGRSIVDSASDTEWKPITSQFPEDVELASRVCKK